MKRELSLTPSMIIYSRCIILSNHPANGHEMDDDRVSRLDLPGVRVRGGQEESVPEDNVAHARDAVAREPAPGTSRKRRRT